MRGPCLENLLKTWIAFSPSLPMKSIWTWVFPSLIHHRPARNPVMMRKHFHTSCSRNTDEGTCLEVSLSSDSWSKRMFYIYASCWDLWEHPFGCSLWASYTHLLVEWVFVHTEDESFSPWLKETSSSVCHWSVHLTSHIGDMRHILSGLDCAYIARKSASGNIYAYIFLKSTKCYKLWTLVFFNPYLCLTVTIWVL